MRGTYVPGPALAELVERELAMDAYQIREINPGLGRNLLRWKAGQGAQIDKADKVCCELGHHISEVYEGYFEEAV